MKRVNYNQIARFETATELINILMGLCIFLQAKESKFATLLDKKYFELSEEKRALRVKDDNMVKRVINTYTPIARSYYTNPKEFKLTQSFFDTRVDNEN